MGFDNECILNIQNLPGEYFCPICRTLIYPDEALQSQCTHLYCKPCLAYVVGTTRACPYDGYLVTEADSKPLIESNKSIADAIGKVPVYCLYHRSGCQWQGTLTECIAHCAECSYGNCPVICNRCGIHIIHRQVQEHAHNCPSLQSQPQQLDNAQTQVSAGQSEIINEASSTASTSAAMSAPSAMPVASSMASAQTVTSTAITSAVAGSDSTTAAASDQATQTQAAAIAQPQAPSAEQWYQQQQMQYQQYYQQYPGYDPYQQHYQHYGPYQQQVQQYPQAYMQVPVQPVVQGQQQPVHTMQPQPQSQPHSQLPMQTQPSLQSQPQGQAAQPQTQPQPQALTAQLQPQQQHYPQLPQHPQQPQHHSHQLHVPAQQVLPQTQTQNHPPPYAQMARQSQTQPHPHAQPLQFPTQPYPQLSKTIPPQSHPHPQMQQPQPSRQQSHMQQQPHPQPHLRPQGQPIPQSQPQQPAAQAVTGHQSYPQPYPFQPAPSGAPQQRPMHMHPQHLQAPHQPAPYTGQMHNQFPPQQNQMRPPPNPVPGQAQQMGMLPPQSSHPSAVPSLQPGQQLHHHVSMQPQQILPHQQAQGQLHPTQQYQQGPYLPQQPIRSQAPTSQQSIPAHPVAHGVTQVPAPGPTVISHGTPQQASQQISAQYPSDSNLAMSSEVKSGTMQHAQVTHPQGSLLPQPSALQSGDQNQVSAAKESSRLIASELHGKSSPDKVAQAHNVAAEAEPKNSKGTEVALTKIPSESLAVSVLHEGKANADSGESDGQDVLESAHVKAAQNESMDVQVVEHGTEKEVSHYTNDVKEVSSLSAAHRDILSNDTGRVHSLPESRGSLSSSQSKEQVPIADVPQAIPPAGSFPGEKYVHQTYGISSNLSEHTVNSQRASAPDRMVPQHMSDPIPAQERFSEIPPNQMQPHDPPFAQSQMRPPVHNILENRPPQGQGRQPYGSYLNEVPKVGHLGSFSNYSSSAGALGQNRFPGPPAGVFGAAGGMTSNPPPGLESQTGQPRHTNVINGDHSKGLVGGTERFGSLPEERFRPFSEERFRQDPYRHGTNHGELEEDFKRFPKPTHLESEGIPKFDGHFSSSWPVEGSRALGGAFPPNSSGSNLLPMDMREHHKPGGIHDEWGRRSDAPGAIPGVGNHLVGSLPPLRSPGREYTGFEMRKFGFSKQSSDNFGKEPLNFGERAHAFNIPSDSFSNSFLEPRFPRPYAPGPTSFQGGSTDGPQHMRMMDQLPSRNFPGDGGNELDGPAIRPSHFRHLRSNEAFGRSRLHLGEPGGFGGLHRDTRMGERSFPGHFPPHGRESTGYLPVHMRSGESGLAHNYSMHGFPNEAGRFGLVSNFNEVDSFGHSSKRNLGSMGWCRICKIDCGSVEGLDIHSQTREHQKMAMDIVLNIKQENSKKKKKALDDETAIEGPSKSRKVKV